jgi:hypothetical protein
MNILIMIFFLSILHSYYFIGNQTKRKKKRMRGCECFCTLKETNKKQKEETTF